MNLTRSNFVNAKRTRPVEAVTTATVEPVERIARMLIADDDPSIVRLLADRCARMGFDVETVTNGVQALVRARQSQFDILLIDVNMPEVDGLTVCAHLLNPDRKPLHVIVMTGSRARETAESCEGFGAFYALKGVDFWRSFAAALIEIYPSSAQAIQAQIRSQDTEPKRRPRMLLIDDDADVGKFLASRLKKYGIDLLCASDVAHGYRIACNEEPSVIISDYFMPNGDAHYLMSRLRTNPATENIPVIVISGKQLDEFRKQDLMRATCGKAGVARILIKSSDTHELFSALRKFCGFEGVADFEERQA